MQQLSPPPAAALAAVDPAAGVGCSTYYYRVRRERHVGTLVAAAEGAAVIHTDLFKYLLTPRMNSLVLRWNKEML